jgi:transposase
LGIRCICPPFLLILSKLWTPFFPAYIITARDYDKEIYKERNLVERLFQKLKEYRRVATRYERLVVNYMTMLSLASVLIWLK